MRKTKAKLIYNPTAGQIWNQFKPEFAKKFLENRGWNVDISATQEKGDATKQAKIAVDEEYDVVISAGGDGTINEIIQSIAGNNIILGILPVGTTNVLARELKIPLNYERALSILVSGKVVDCDLGMINNKYFSLMAGIGFDAQLVKDVDSFLKKISGIIAFAASTPMTIIKNKATKMKIVLWDQKRKRKVLKRKCHQIIISNIETYAIDYIISPSAKFDDGLLNVAIFRTKKLIDFILGLAYIVFNRKSEDKITEHYHISKMTIKTHEPVPIQIDGDHIGFTPANIEVKPNYLKVIKPMD